MTEDHEREIATRVKAAESIEAGIRQEVKRDLYERRDIVAALVHQGVLLPFTDGECRRLYDAGQGDAAIAEHFGLTPWNVFVWRKKHNLTGHEQGPVCVEVKQRKMPKKLDDAKTMELYNAGKSDGAIAREMGVTTSAVQQWRRRNNLVAKCGNNWNKRQEAVPTGSKAPEEEPAQNMTEQQYEAQLAAQSPAVVGTACDVHGCATGTVTLNREEAALIRQMLTEAVEAGNGISQMRRFLALFEKIEKAGI